MEEQEIRQVHVLKKITT